MAAQARTHPPEQADARTTARHRSWLSTKGPAAERRQVPLFAIDVRCYTVDKPQPPNVGLQYLHQLHPQGPQVAYAFMLEAMLGEEGFAVLMGYDKLQPEHMERLIKDALGILLGSHDGPKGQPKKRRRR